MVGHRPSGKTSRPVVSSIDTIGELQTFDVRQVVHSVAAQHIVGDRHDVVREIERRAAVVDSDRVVDLLFPGTPPYRNCRPPGALAVPAGSRVPQRADRDCRRRPPSAGSAARGCRSWRSRAGTVVVRAHADAHVQPRVAIDHVVAAAAQDDVAAVAGENDVAGTEPRDVSGVRNPNA